MIACARNANEPASRRELGIAARDIARLQHVALHAVDRAAGLASARSRDGGSETVTSPRLSASRTRRTNGSITPGPVPQVT